MEFVGVIGSGEYRKKYLMISTLENLIDTEEDVVVSGHSPRNNYQNVDVWAEEWAKKFCDKKPIIFPPKKFTSYHFKLRNKKIAKKSTMIVGFVPKGLYKSGTWNTIYHYVKFGKSIKDIVVFDEDNFAWNYDEYPKYIVKNSHQDIEAFLI